MRIKKIWCVAIKYRGLSNGISIIYYLMGLDICRNETDRNNKENMTLSSILLLKTKYYIRLKSMKCALNIAQIAKIKSISECGKRFSLCTATR